MPSTTAKKPPRRKPESDLVAVQRFMHRALLRPLAPGNRMQRRWVDGRPMAEAVAEHIRPNDRLTAFERLEIYNRMYWFRLVDNFYDDNPGQRALLGERKFHALAEAYLTAHPSRSFTLRNLCSGLADFIRKAPRWTAPHARLAWEVARFEWAQTVGFDGEARPAATAADFARADPQKLKLALQPYLTLLELDHPVDSFVIAVKKRDTLRAEASNATASDHHAKRLRRVAPPRRERTWVAVHRSDNRLYYKRLEAPAYRILCALRDGRPLAQAVAAGGKGVTPTQVQEWFALWSKLGWICRRK